MLNFKKEKVNIDDKLKQRIDFICKFCGFKPTFEAGNIIRFWYLKNELQFVIKDHFVEMVK